MIVIVARHNAQTAHNRHPVPVDMRVTNLTPLVWIEVGMSMRVWLPIGPVHFHSPTSNLIHILNDRDHVGFVKFLEIRLGLRNVLPRSLGNLIHGYRAALVNGVHDITCRPLRTHFVYGPLPRLC